ncbi:hypothetical protein IQC45_19245 [Leptospira interrogans serovar Pomona]|nr:hypothetical protein [Leptospira interrogans serovar Pomona]
MGKAVVRAFFAPRKVMKDLVTKERGILKKFKHNFFKKKGRIRIAGYRKGWKEKQQLEWFSFN